MTEMNDNDLDRLFREKFAGKEAPPPDSAWTNIERELGKAPGHSGYGRWWISGISALVIGLSGWWYFGSRHSSAGQLAENHADQNNVQITVPSSQNLSANETKTTSAETTNAPDNAAGLKTPVAPENPASPASGKILPDEKNKTDEQPALTASSVSAKKTGNAFPETISEPAKGGLAKETTKPSQGDLTVVGHGNKGKYDDQRDPGPHVPLVAYDQQHSAINHEAKSENEPQYIPVDAPVKATAADSFPVSGISEKALADSALMAEMTAPAAQKSDSQSTAAENAGGSSMQNNLLPAFFAGLHVYIDNQKVVYSEQNTEGFTRSDVALYDEHSQPVISSQNYSYGGRLGWFASKHLALVGGIYFNSFQISSTGGSMRYNHNDEVLFTLYSAASSVHLHSHSFNHEDSYNGASDTFLVRLSSKENYSFVNFQLGGAYYLWRTPLFGAYVNLLANGAYLTKENMTLTSSKTGKSFYFNKDQMLGMNKLTLGTQLGTGFEFTPVPNLGIWFEPAYFFSAELNKKNPFTLKPSAFRFQCGLSAHF